MVEIIETDDSVANTIDGKIYLNKHLREFPELRERIISHELEHQKSHGFWHNRKIDALTDLSFRDMLPFYKKYPRFFIQQHLPVFYKEGVLYFNWSIIFLLLIYGGIAFGIFGLIKLFSFDSTFFWSVIKNIAWILPTALFVIWGIKKLVKIVNREAPK